jgi:hypothetical protein
VAMIRKQLYIDSEQQRKLRSLARRWGCTEAEVMRRALDSVPEFESAIDARLHEAGLLVAPPDDGDLPTESSPEVWEDLERELDELLAETGPLHLAEVVIEDRG